MLIPAQTKGPAQVKTETSSNFPAGNPSGAGPQGHPCHLRGGEDTLQGWMAGEWLLSPAGKQCQKKEATGWESMPAEAEGTVSSCLTLSSMSGGPGGIQLAL